MAQKCVIERAGRGDSDDGAALAARVADEALVRNSRCDGSRRSGRHPAAEMVSWLLSRLRAHRVLRQPISRSHFILWIFLCGVDAAGDHFSPVWQGFSAA